MVKYSLAKNTTMFRTFYFNKFVYILRHIGGILAIVALGSVVLALLNHVAGGIDYEEFIQTIRRTPYSAISLSLAATTISFASLIIRDYLALRCVGVRAPAAAIALAGFCGTALGNAVGYGALTGGIVRYRIYGAVGIKAEAIARMMLFIAGGFAVGLTFFTASVIFIDTQPAASLTGWASPLLKSISFTALAGC